MKLAYLVGINEVGTWGIEELWITPRPADDFSRRASLVGTYRGPFRTKEEAIEREEAIGKENEWDLVRMERVAGKEELLGNTPDE